MKLFDRVASVTFGPSGSEDGIEINALRIQFTVTKTMTRTTNTAKIMIYNLTIDTHSKLRIGDVLVLRAGYRQGSSSPPILALGAIKSVARRHETADIISEVTLEDGLLELKQNRLSVSFPDGTKAVDVLDTAIDGLGLDAYELPELDQAVEYGNGFAFEGPARELMGKVCDRLDLSWSVQTGKILVTPKGSTGKIEAVMIGPASGLISTPEKIADEPNELQAEADRRPNGWKIRSLLRPEVIPGGTLSVESSTVAGSFRIEEVTHAGDTHGDDWSSLTTVREPREVA